MSKITDQMNIWLGSFGKEYTDRNAITLEEMEALTKRNYGVTRTEINRRFLERIDRSAPILEVGSNIGNQLLCLQKMGFRNLYGIELQSYVAEFSKHRTRNINIIQGSAFDIPFKDDYFTLVFTAGLLIHIHPSDIAEVMKEIHRCTREYILGSEYWGSQITEVVYRGHQNLLWKADYSRLYLELFDDLVLVKEEQLKYLNNDNVDSIFLLRKRNSG